MTITYGPQMTVDEAHACNTTVKEYDDTQVKHKIITWWNDRHPTNRVQLNENIYGIDLVGIDNPAFGIEVERSKSWTSHHRPLQFKSVRIPIRKAGYWLPPDKDHQFVQTNMDMTSCVLLTSDVIRTKFYNKWLKTKYGYMEHFLEYYTWEYHELTSH